MASSAASSNNQNPSADDLPGLELQLPLLEPPPDSSSSMGTVIPPPVSVVPTTSSWTSG
jgi:hypothetical protein